MKPRIVFLVDDDNDDTELFREALAEAGGVHEFHHCADGTKALRVLEEGLNPDVVFLDINMPRCSGWELLRSIKSDDRLREMPVIMYSTSNNPDEIRRARQSGALFFLNKPASFTQLIKSLRLVLENLP